MTERTRVTPPPPELPTRHYLQVISEEGDSIEGTTLLTPAQAQALEVAFAQQLQAWGYDADLFGIDVSEDEDDYDFGWLPDTTQMAREILTEGGFGPQDGTDDERFFCGIDYMAGQICMLPPNHGGPHR